MTQHRTRKTSQDDRRQILDLLSTGKYSQAQIARMFSITQARVSQIKRNHEAESCGSPDDSEADP
jgi:predicted XRE-type DNA-binding protein